MLLGISREICFSWKDRPLCLFFFGGILSSKSSLARNSSCCLFSICPYVPHKLGLVSVLSLYLEAVIGRDEQRHEGRQHKHKQAYQMVWIPAFPQEAGSLMFRSCHHSTELLQSRVQPAPLFCLLATETVIQVTTTSPNLLLP